jgi:hypothetical protein
MHGHPLADHGVTEEVKQEIISVPCDCSSQGGTGRAEDKAFGEVLAN